MMLYSQMMAVMVSLYATESIVGVALVVESVEEGGVGSWVITETLTEPLLLLPDLLLLLSSFEGIEEEEEEVERLLGYVGVGRGGPTS